VSKAPVRYPFTFTRNGSMRPKADGESYATAMRVLRQQFKVTAPTTPTALAVSAEIERQHAVVERAVRIIGWPIRLPEPMTKETA
jgi:hypothetical protein